MPPLKSLLKPGEKTKSVCIYPISAIPWLEIKNTGPIPIPLKGLSLHANYLAFTHRVLGAADGVSIKNARKIQHAFCGKEINLPFILIAPTSHWLKLA